MVFCVSLRATALRTSATIYQDVMVSGIFYSNIDIHSCYIFMNRNKFSGRLVVPWSEWYFVCCFRLSRGFLAHLETSSLPMKACKFRLTLMFIKQWRFSWLDTPCATWGTCFQVALTFMKVVEHLSVEL